MKKILALSFAVAILGFSVSAQQTREMKSHRKGGSMQHGQKEMYKDLNLSEAQKAQLKTNREANKAKMEALDKQDNLTVKEMRARKTALMQEQKAQMESILTAEQKSKIAADRSAMAGKRKNMDGQRGEAMKEKLGLSNDQAAKLKAQNEATREKVKSIQANQSLSADQKKEQMKAVKDAANAERKNILTAEQIKKMEEMKKEGRKDKMKGRKDKK